MQAVLISTDRLCDNEYANEGEDKQTTPLYMNMVIKELCTSTRENENF